MNTETVTATDAAQFLSVLPRLVGCSPVRSLVLVPLDRGRSLGAMRIDLGPDEPETADRVASTAIGFMCRIRNADSVVATIYTDASASSGLPYRVLADALGKHADASGLHLLDVLAVASDGWGSHCDDDQRVRDLHELAPVDVEHDQTSGADLPPVSADERHAVEGARAALARAIAAVSGVAAPGDGSAFRKDDAACGALSPEALESTCALADLPVLYEEALEWDADDLSPAQVALVTWCLTRPALRDVAIVQWSADFALGERAEQAQHRWEEGAEYPVDLAERMWGEGSQPDPERVQRALRLVRRVAALVPDQAAPLAVCAWLSWALGRSTHAEQYVRRAQSIEPLHGLTEIVGSFVAAGHLPDWAFGHADALRGRR